MIILFIFAIIVLVFLLLAGVSIVFFIINIINSNKLKKLDVNKKYSGYYLPIILVVTILSYIFQLYFIAGIYNFVMFFKILGAIKDLKENKNDFNVNNPDCNRIETHNNL